MTKLWTVQDVADYLGVPVKTLYQWRCTGYGPARARRQVPAVQARRRHRLVRSPRQQDCLGYVDGETTVTRGDNGGRAVLSAAQWPCPSHN